jgi:hypothetical protein
LRNRNATDFFDTAQRVGTVTVVAGDNDSDQPAAQCSVSERRKTVITSGPPRTFEIGLSLNSSPSTCKSRFAGIMKTWFGSINSFSVI